MIYVLSAIILALLAERTWTTRSWAKERRDLINAILAKNPSELTMLRAEPQPVPAPTPLPEGFEGQWGS